MHGRRLAAMALLAATVRSAPLLPMAFAPSDPPGDKPAVMLQLGEDQAAMAQLSDVAPLCADTNTTDISCADITLADCALSAVVEL